jgi:hypothetical protein
MAVQADWTAGRFSERPTGTTRRDSKRESRTVVLRHDSQQAQEAATHRFLRAEDATLRSMTAVAVLTRRCWLRLPETAH